MSYILDALQKAEADRRMEAGDDFESVAFSAGAPSVGTEGKPMLRKWWAMGAMGLLVIVAAASAGWWISKRQPQTDVSVDEANRTSTGSVGSPDTEATRDAKGRPHPTTAQPEVDAQESGPTPPILVAPDPPPRPRPATATASVKPATAVEPQSAPALSATSEVTTPATSAKAAPRPGEQVLPNFERTSGLPQLSISGASYSDNPAHRMIIVNGEVIKEGQQVAPGVVVEVIGARSAILKHGGKRYNVNY
ncbi:general secretion pathway protein GspB [Hydrogenophaga sp. 5NK40-0174]|uniref:general secretion pathway protein GspB n=1 Tax=Hydrogenophaga sp. 5NK40-0174 TaxID=3127649 RepID=UPI003102FF92